VTNCNGTLLVGGFGVFASISTNTSQQYIQRVYQDLPEHNVIYYTFTIYMIDSWDGNDYLNLKFDNEIIKTNYSLSIGNFPEENVCGSESWDDLPNVRVFGRVNHIGSTLTLSFISGLNEPSENESFGIRDITLTFIKDSAPVSSNICGIAAISLTENDCACPEKEYEESLGVCKACHESCASCFGPTESDCFSCQIGTVSNGSHCMPCNLNMGDILDVDGICKGIFDNIKNN